MCWQGQCTGTPTLKFIDGVRDVPCAVVQVVTAPDNTPINVLLESAHDSPAARSAAVDAATKFASTFADELVMLGRTGHNGSVDRDGDGRMTVVFADLSGANKNDASGSSLVGFFAAEDMLAQNSNTSVTPDGNVADLLWVTVPDGTTVTSTTAAGTMAHEYVHLTSFAVRVFEQQFGAANTEALWLDEAMAHTMEDLAGWGPTTIRVVEQALDKWNTTTLASQADSTLQRGTAYLFLRYLIDQAGRLAGATDAAAHEVHTAAGAVIGGLLKDPNRGYGHAALRGLSADDVAHWQLAVYATGNSAVTHEEAHAYDFLPTGTSATTHFTIGMNPRLTTYVDGAGATVDLRGPDTNELDNTSADVSSDFDESGHAVYHATGFDARTTTLVNATVTPVAGPFLRVIQVEGTPQ
jgi:hypothetical protein